MYFCYFSAEQFDILFNAVIFMCFKYFLRPVPVFEATLIVWTEAWLCAEECSCGQVEVNGSALWRRGRRGAAALWRGDGELRDALLLRQNLPLLLSPLFCADTLNHGWVRCFFRHTQRVTAPVTRHSNVKRVRTSRVVYTIIWQIHWTASSAWQFDY